MLNIHNITVVTPNLYINNGAVLTNGTKIKAVGTADEIDRPSKATLIDGSGLLLVPGFIDLQLNGAFGDDFTADPDSIWSVASKLPGYGVTSFLPTIITSPLETISAAQRILTQGPPPDWHGARPLGLHIEGPFLNPLKKGAHNPNHLRLPSLDVIQDWSPDQAVKLVTLAPEMPGALTVIKSLDARGVVVSAGHSMATYADAQLAFEAGVSYGTHMFNAMPVLGHREPGLPGALLTNSGITAGLIPDGIHVHPAVIKLIWTAKGSGRLNLVSDAMAALGMPPGQYHLGDQTVVVTETEARLHDGALAGSIVSLDVALRNLINFTGCSLAEALSTVTTTPASLLGLSHQRGKIAPGLAADLVLLRPDLQVEMTIIKGQIQYKRGRL